MGEEVSAPVELDDRINRILLALEQWNPIVFGKQLLFSLYGKRHLSPLPRCSPALAKSGRNQEMDSNTLYTRDNVIVTTFKACDDTTKQRFKEWALSLKPELDGGEYGADENGQPLPNSAYLWVLQHNATAEFTNDGVYQTFIVMDKASGEFLATGSIVPDDRGINNKYAIGSRGFWGFANVRRDLRGRGLGKLLSAYRNEHVQKFVDRLGEPANFSLFTTNEIAARVSKELGFKFVRRIYVEEFEAEEDLYTKTYVPR